MVVHGFDTSWVFINNSSFIPAFLQSDMSSKQKDFEIKYNQYIVISNLLIVNKCCGYWIVIAPDVLTSVSSFSLRLRGLFPFLFCPTTALIAIIATQKYHSRRVDNAMMLVILNIFIFAARHSNIYFFFLIPKVTNPLDSTFTSTVYTAPTVGILSE
jgi:hypothetical protein